MFALFRLFLTVTTVLIASVSVLSADQLQEFEIFPGYSLSDAPVEIQAILQNKDGLTETEVAQLFTFIAILGEEINVGGGQPTTCSILDADCKPDPTRPKFDGIANTFAFLPTGGGEFGFMTQGVAYGANGMSYAVNKYNVPGVKDFADVIVATPEVTCLPGDLTCLQQGWRDRDPFEKPEYPSRVSCLGAEITDPEAIASLYGTLRGTAQGIRQTVIQSIHDSTFTTPGDINELKLSDLAMSEERFQKIDEQSRRAPEMLSPNRMDRIRKRFNEQEARRRQTGKIFPTLGYSSQQSGVVFGVSKYTP